MTLRVQVDPDTEAAISSKAKDSGMAPEQFVEALLEREFSQKQTQPLSQAEVDTFFADLRKLSSSATGLLDPNFTREAIFICEPRLVDGCRLPVRH